MQKNYSKVVVYYARIMPSLTGSYNIQAVDGSSINSDNVGLLTAFPLATASATIELLGPTLTSKAPKHNPVFTGYVGGVTAEMVSTTDASNVQDKLNLLSIKADEQNTKASNATVSINTHTQNIASLQTSLTAAETSIQQLNQEMDNI